MPPLDFSNACAPPDRGPGQSRGVDNGLEHGAFEKPYFQFSGFPVRDLRQTTLPPNWSRLTRIILRCRSPLTINPNSPRPAAILRNVISHVSPRFVALNTAARRTASPQRNLIARKDFTQ